MAKIPTGMTARQFQAALDKLGLSVRYGSKWLGMSERQGRRIVAGEGEVPGAAIKLLRLMIARGITPDEVDQISA